MKKPVVIATLGVFLMSGCVQTTTHGFDQESLMRLADYQRCMSGDMPPLPPGKYDSVPDCWIFYTRIPRIYREAVSPPDGNQENNSPTRPGDRGPTDPVDPGPKEPRSKGVEGSRTLDGRAEARSVRDGVVENVSAGLKEDGTRGADAVEGDVGSFADAAKAQEEASGFWD